MVLFETNEYSWHGFLPVTKDVPEGVTRKSLAIYMYTKDRPVSEKFPKHGTFYVPRIPIEKLKVNSLLDRQLLEELLSSRAHALQLIKNLYEHEKKLNDYVNDRFYEISLLQEEIKSLKSQRP
jgi:hypothetical protein